MQEAQKNEELQEEVFDLEEMFEKIRTEKGAMPFLADETPEKVEEPEQKTKSPEPSDEDEDDTEAEAKPAKKEAPKEKEIDYKAELEKAQKTIRDTQKSFHEDRKKLAAYKKAVEKLNEEGALTEEEATLLLDHTKYEEVTEDVPLLTRYFNIWDKEIEDMRKVYEKGYISKPDEFDQHILAFQHFIQTASPKELQDALDDFSKIEDNPVELTKQMLEIGRQYNDDIYSDIHEVGGIRNLKSMYFKKEEELKNKIDKLEEKYNKLKQKYEDHDTAPVNYRNTVGRRNVDVPKYDKVDLDAFFDSLA